MEDIDEASMDKFNSSLIFEKSFNYKLAESYSSRVEIRRSITLLIQIISSYFAHIKSNS
jgi:hypothetical protein